MTAYSPKELVNAVFEHLDTLSYRETSKALRLLRKNGYPRFLFKFRGITDSQHDPNYSESLNRLRQIIVASNLWLCSPHAFNDPFDMTAKFLFDAEDEIKLTRFREALEASGKSSKEIKTLLPQYMARGKTENTAAAGEVHQVLIKQTGVVCFAGDPRSILMWSHYSSNHSGLCLIFEVARDPRTFLQAQQVSYSNEYPVVNWFSDRDKFAEKIVLRKYIGWTYEGERRIVLVDRANEPLPFRAEALRAIIIGCRMEAAALKDLRGLLDERASAGHPPVYLYECKKHESDYRLRIFRRR